MVQTPRLRRIAGSVSVCLSAGRCLSLPRALCPSLSLSMCPSLCLYVCRCFFLPRPLSPCPSAYSSVCLARYKESGRTMAVRISSSVSRSLSVCVCLPLSLSRSLWLSLSGVGQSGGRTIAVRSCESLSRSTRAPSATCAAMPPWRGVRDIGFTPVHHLTVLLSHSLGRDSFGGRVVSSQDFSLSLNSAPQ